MKRKCLIALDGLSVSDFEFMSSLMPNARKMFQTFDCLDIDGATLCSAQAVWAEILTGERWFTNGCVGYSRPTHSVNKLSVASEKDLLKPPKLANSESHNAFTISINVPLLEPTVGRIWLSDGSLPINKIVSPTKLLGEEPFSTYTPRPLKSLAVYEQPINQLIEKCLAVETKRLDCAQTLFAEPNWSTFIYRISVFDYLTHLLGLSYLRAQDLYCSVNIKNFIDRLDHFLQVIRHDDVELVVMSGYSHTPCRGILNLNILLQRGGFLQTEKDSDIECAGRIKAATPLLKCKPSGLLLGSMEGSLNTSVTTAASPVAGAVFINRKEAFVDGCVDEEQSDNVRLELRSFLHNRFSQMYGSSFLIEEKPERARSLPTPDFMVFIEGIELSNMKENDARTNMVPRTTHFPKGFVSLPKGLEPAGNSLRLCQLSKIFGSSKQSSALMRTNNG